ncbi:MAG TPA: CPBP family intramembrane glutamic endopeptidase [Candidatus Limnocylindrales bacterium]|nr:CPBP family intramembrane glutamic endopeptidase [Candidatus Limnocylindrales bacterium]
MNAGATALGRARVAPGVAAWARPVALLAGLVLVIGARWAGTRAGMDPLVLGAAFGVAVIALGWTRPSLPAARDLVIGLAAGLALVALTGLGAAIAGSTLPSGLGRPAAPFLPWAAITIVVAAGEESILRGRLFDATRRAGGTVAAVALTTIVFALLHVPLYGWHVVPLDLGVGLAFAGLRLLTRGIAAPATAHAVADLATWWL